VEADEMLSYEDVQEILRIPLIGIIPESEQVLHASNQGNPAIHFKGTDVAEAYEDVVSRFLGQDCRCALPPEKPGLLQRIFGSK
jgi:septum site-determining protein MinD